MSTYTLISEQFASSQGYADVAFQESLNFLNTLQGIVNQPFTQWMEDVEYQFPTPVVDPDLDSLKPEAPTDESLEMDEVTMPAAPSLDTVIVPEIPAAPANTFSFTESTYASTLLTSLRDNLLADLAAGGTGLGADVEAAIWNRARARTALENQKVRDQLESGIAARGWTIPPGALQSAITEAVIEETRANSDINEKILIEQARLAQEYKKNILESVIRIESTLIEYTGQKAARTLDAARAAIQASIDIHNASMIAAKAEVEIVSNANKMKLEEYLAAIEATKAHMELAASKVEVVLKAYLGKGEIYKTAVQAASIDLDAQIEIYKGRLQQARNETDIILEQGKANVQTYLQNRQVVIEAVQAAATICSQLAASAMSAVHASASGAYSETMSYRPNSLNEKDISESTSHVYTYSE